ncbi:glycosyltransferase [Burkholderia diffusa]|uniref:glycosyltransferase n=1 Tax=Burkholderia diffusa TaxID=488732 RepID=UPI002ABDA610|nr:glycosyltransferase [Burkholderia diffusa]
MKSKIVHVTEAFGGGVLSFLVDLCNRSIAAGYDVVVVYSERDETPKNVRELFDPAVRLIRVPMHRSIRPLRDFGGVLRLTHRLRSERPDVIHLHSSKAGALGRVAARLGARHARVIYSPHGLSFLRSDVPRWQQWLYLTFERLADSFGGTVVACSLGELDELRRRVRVRNARLIENGVEIEHVPKRRVRGDDRTIVGMMGRASYQKNHEWFLAVANRLAQPDLEFVWIGGEAIEVGRGTGVRCTGWVPRSEALAAMAGLDLYVQTSRWEGMPLAVIEAQVAGIPAIVTNVIGNRDIVVHGKTGFIASSLDEIAEYVSRLVRDPALRQTMGDAAARVATARFRVESKFRQWASLYDDSVSYAAVSESPAAGHLDLEMLPGNGEIR